MHWYGITLSAGYIIIPALLLTSFFLYRSNEKQGVDDRTSYILKTPSIYMTALNSCEIMFTLVHLLCVGLHLILTSLVVLFYYQ